MRMGAFLRAILRQAGFGPPQEALLETMQIRGSAMAGLKSACAGGAAKRKEGGVRGLAPARGSLSPRDGLSVLRSFSQMDCRRAVAAFAHGKCLRECAPCKRPPCCGQWDAPIARGDRGDAGAEATQSGRGADSRNAAGAGGANRMPSRMRRTPGFGAARWKRNAGAFLKRQIMDAYGEGGHRAAGQGRAGATNSVKPDGDAPRWKGNAGAFLRERTGPAPVRRIQS